MANIRIFDRWGPLQTSNGWDKGENFQSRCLHLFVFSNTLKLTKHSERERERERENFTHSLMGCVSSKHIKKDLKQEEVEKEKENEKNEKDEKIRMKRGVEVNKLERRKEKKL